MIIGNGSIAKLLNDRKGFTFFASGISNSKSDCSIPERNREHELLANEIEKANSKKQMFVYFSTISIFFSHSEYAYHKKFVEMAVKHDAKNYCIIRLGNIWECTNPYTFINAYKNKPYEPKDEYRYMISKEQLNFITDNLPRTGKHEISIFGEALKVSECIKRIK